MSNIRLAGIPLEHVVAEVAAYPIASAASFKLAPVSLQADLKEAMQPLWRDAEKYILSGFPAFSVEEAVAVRDKLWFDKGSRFVALNQYLYHIAKTFLCVHGNIAVPRFSDGSSETSPHSVFRSDAALARRSWKWLSFAMPPDLLLAALWDKRSRPSKINIMDPRLERHLMDKKYAELHLHVGAAIDFSTIWVSALLLLSDPQLSINAFQNPGAEFNEGRDFASWLIRAAVARYIMAVFLKRRHPEMTFNEYLESEILPQIMEEAGPGACINVHTALTDLLRGCMNQDGDDRHQFADDHNLEERNYFAHIKGIYAQLTDIAANEPLKCLEDMPRADPISFLYEPELSDALWPEMLFVADALNYLSARQQKPDYDQDTLFTTLFWQITRIRNLFYRHVVQRPLTPGLQWFIRFYDRMRAGKKRINEKIEIESALKIGGINHGLLALEYRSGPPVDISNALMATDALEENISNNIEIGLVYHFIKIRDDGTSKGLPIPYWHKSNADPTLGSDIETFRNPRGYRYSAYYSKIRKEAFAMTWLFRFFPRSVSLVRGVDVCSDELGVPNWVMAPLIQYVRNCAESASEKLVRGGYGRVPRFGTTVHAGEDFVHLLTGMRNMDLVIEFFGLGEGDRIGHGLALGVDPVQWARHSGSIPMAYEERMWDLIWEWNWYGRHGCIPDGGRPQFIERQIAILSEHTFGRSRTAYQLETLAKDLYNGAMLRAVGFPDEDRQFVEFSFRRLPNLKERLENLYEYLTDPAIFNRGRDIIWIDTDSEEGTLVHIQNQMRQKVGTSGITIEVNPTSNLLIGDLGDMTSHPLWRLKPPRGDDVPPVRICIGSDDPLVFASKLPEEYQWLCDALRLAGLSDDEALSWIEEVRAAGMDSRFTYPVQRHESVRKYPYFGGLNVPPPP